MLATFFQIRLQLIGIMLFMCSCTPHAQYFPMKQVSESEVHRITKRSAEPGFLQRIIQSFKKGWRDGKLYYDNRVTKQNPGYDRHLQHQTGSKFANDDYYSQFIPGQSYRNHYNVGKTPSNKRNYHNNFEEHRINKVHSHHDPHNAYKAKPPTWFESDDYGNPFDEGHFDFEGFGPWDSEEENGKNHQNNNTNIDNNLIKDETKTTKEQNVSNKSSKEKLKDNELSTTHSPSSIEISNYHHINSDIYDQQSNK